MSLWSEQLLPRLTDVALRSREIGDFRSRAVAGLTGSVVELGFGSGLNVPHYPAEVTVVHAIEPSRVARRLAARRVASSHAEVRYSGLDGQDLPLDDASVDHALVTFALCTIPDPLLALRETRRVLRAGGRLHFLEHGLSPDSGVALWQHRLAPVQACVAGGCHLDRAIDGLVQAAGFTICDLHNAQLPGPRLSRPWGYLYWGVAEA